MSAQDSNAATAVCPRCGDELGCGARADAAAGEVRCWCFEAPPVEPDPALGGRCLCPRCLAAVTASGSARPAAGE